MTGAGATSPLETIAGGSIRPTSVTDTRADMSRCTPTHRHSAFPWCHSLSTRTGAATTTIARGTGSGTSGYIAGSSTGGRQARHRAGAHRRVRRFEMKDLTRDRSPINGCGSVVLLPHTAMRTHTTIRIGMTAQRVTLIWRAILIRDRLKYATRIIRHRETNLASET